MAGLRIVFMGSAELSCDSLAALLRHPEFDVVGVVTQPDRPKGRDLKLQACPPKELAQRHHLRLLQPEKVRDANFFNELQALALDLGVVAAYGQILPKRILDLPRFGCVNVHASLLPQYRGAAPIQWAIANGDTETGVTLMKMDAGLDTGDILAQQATPIRPEDNAETLHDRLARMGAELLVQTIPDFVAGKIQPRPQPTTGVSHAPKIRKEDGRIDWQLPAQAIWNRIRAFTPWPGAFTRLPAEPHPQLLKIWEAKIVERSGKPGEILSADKTGIVVGCGQQALGILTLQRESGRKMSAQEFWVGHPLKPGDSLQ